jgi:hypothetical protein
MDLAALPPLGSFLCIAAAGGGVGEATHAQRRCRLGRGVREEGPPRYGGGGGEGLQAGPALVGRGHLPVAGVP